MIRLLLLVPLLALAAPAAAEIGALDPYERRFDLRIVAATARHWRPHYNRPDAWKAQLIAESGLNPAAVSPVGARGLAQFIPATWSSEIARLGLPRTLSPHDAEAIDVGAAYMRRIRDLFIPYFADEEERQRHARAGYNSGPGNTLKAVRRCDSRHWQDTTICYPGVTGRHADETIGYVSRIETIIDSIRTGRKPLRRPVGKR